MAVILSENAKDLVRSNFFGKDFDTYVREITDYLKLQFGPEITSNIVVQEFGQYLIEMHAFALSTAAWYGDRQTDDLNLRYVRLRAAANVIARQLGYKPRAAVPPAITLTMTLAFPPSLTRLTLERGRKLVGPNGLIYVMTEDVIFDVGEVGPKTFSAVEGEFIEEIFTSTGEPNQFFLLEGVPPGKSIAQDSPRVYVNNVEWSESTLLTFDRTNQFEVQYGFNPPRLQFGDGIAGNIPPKDAEIRVVYLATSGPAGAVQANAVTAFQEALVAGTETLSATLVHNEASTTGSDRETIESIKVNAPLVTQAAGRAVTQKDLDALISAFIDPVFGAVAVGRATVPRAVDHDAEALTIIALIEAAGVSSDVVQRLRNYWNKVLASNCAANVVVVQILSADSIGRYVSAPVGLARALEAYLDERVESTVKVRVTDGSINLLAVDLTVEIKLLRGYENDVARATVLNAVKTALETELLGRSYGESLWIGDLYAAVEAIDGIDYSHVAITGINGLPPATGRLTTYGDLEIADYEVITLGTSPVITVL